MRPSPERISSTRRTRSSSSRPSVAKSLMKVERLISLMVALTPWEPGTVWTTRSKSSSPRRAVVRPVCGRPAPRRVQAEHREQGPLERRLEGLRDRVHAEGEAVDPVADRDLLGLRLEADVGGALAGAEGEEVVEDTVRAALLPVDRLPRRRRSWCRSRRVTPCERSAASTSSRRHEPARHEDLAELRRPSRAARRAPRAAAAS